MTIVARLLILLLVAAGLRPTPALALTLPGGSGRLSSPGVALAQQPTPPQPEGARPGGPNPALRLLVVLLCGIGLSSVALGVAIAFKRRMSAISPDPDDDR